MPRKKTVKQKKGSAEWMNTYADLVTLLLCFFVLLFSMSSIDASKFKAFINSFNNSVGLFYSGETIGNGNAIGNGINQLPDFQKIIDGDYGDNSEEQANKNKEIANQFTNYFNEQNLQNQIEVSYTGNYVKLRFTNDSILFDTGEAILKSGAKKTLDLVAIKLKDYDEHIINIEGHTDNVPINTKQFPSNWYLSSARAISVAEYLISTYDFDPHLMSADGRGEYTPIADNNLSEGRAKNRRVEIMIMTKEIEVNGNN